MNVLKTKLWDDFANAHRTSQEITKGIRSLEDGIEIIQTEIKYIYVDIKTLSEDAINELDKKTKELSVLNDQYKQKIKQVWEPLVNDAIDKRNLQRKLLEEDHKKFIQELAIIQQICYRKDLFPTMRG